ncbi:hypothetical protein ACI0FN_02901 [Alcaligenes nematophilus]
MRSLRAKLRNGFICPPEKFRVNDIYWKYGIDYAALEAWPESAKWWLSCMGFLRLLLIEEYLSPEDEKICRFIIEDWEKKLPIKSSLFLRAWDGHAVALRAEVLVQVALRSRDNGYLLNILNDHIDFLLEDDNFQGNWNHGVDQAHALIQLSEYMKFEKGKLIGVRRLEAALDVMVDFEGVTIEQSVHYQLYNFKQLGRSVEVLKKINGHNSNKLVSSLIEKRKKMATFLAHATRPDGSYVEIGDTPSQRAETIPNTDAEFAATFGGRGIAPLEKVKIYSAGYIFGRSGWGQDRAFLDESHYAIRFGPARIVHGHNDHGSILYYTKGKVILRDGGFHGYTDDLMRKFLRQVEAHNSISVSKPDLRFRGRNTILVSSHINDAWQKFELLGSPYDGVTHKRIIFFSRHPEAIIVVDEVIAPTEIVVDQKWHFGGDCHLLKSSDSSFLSDDGLFEVKQHYPFDEIIYSNKNDENNPNVVSGEKMYEIEKCTVLLTKRRGKKVTFLTTFSFISDGEIPKAKDKKSAENNVRRELHIYNKLSKLILYFLDSGSIIFGK